MTVTGSGEGQRSGRTVPSLRKPRAEDRVHLCLVLLILKSFKEYMLKIGGRRAFSTKGGQGRVWACAVPRSPGSPLCLVSQEVLPAAGGAAGPEDVWSSGSTVGLWALQ